jgi:acyl dehydratase
MVGRNIYPSVTIYLEDLRKGDKLDLGTYRPSEAEIVAFGRRFDPQPFHVDPAAAQATHFGGVIASGWHTAAMFQRLWVDAMLLDAASLGGMGIDQMRMSLPVRPGDELRGSLEVLEARPSARKPDRGTAVVRGELHNQDDELVLSLICVGRFGRSPR